MPLLEIIEILLQAIREKKVHIIAYARRTYLGDEGSIVLHQSLIRIVRDNIVQKKLNNFCSGVMLK